jgi:hypothetical protein
MSPWLLAAWLTACSADAVSTHHALNHGATEMFLGQSAWVRDPLIAAQAAALPLLLDRPLRKAGHPKIATAVAIGLTVVRVAAVAHNMRVIP